MKRSSKPVVITYDSRYQISQRIRTLSASELQQALALIFDGLDHPPAGSEECAVLDIQFTVDFAELSSDVCANLLEYFSTLKPVKKAKTSPGMKRPLHPAMLSVLKRVAVRDAGGRHFRRASVLRKLPSGSLLFYDHDNSFQFIELADEDRESKWIEDPIATDVTDASLTKGAHVPRQAMEALLQKLRSLEMIDSFDRPVDPIADCAPDYFDRISEPMDLGTAEDRLKRGLYKGAPELARDIRLTFSNALAYNRPRNPIHDAALVVLSIFEGAWDELCVRYSSSENPEQEQAQWQVGTDQSVEPTSTKSTHSGRGQKKGRSKAASEALTYRRVKVFWPQEGEWHGGTITSLHRQRGDRHLVQYDDGMSEWVDMSRQQVQLLEMVSVPVPSNLSTTPSPPIDKPEAPPAGMAVTQIQKLGKLVWARATGFPWWPAEVCLPTCSEIDTVLMSEAQAANGGRKIMVFYFGEVQYDLLTPDSVVNFDAQNPGRHLDPKRSDEGLAAAITHALERNTQLKQSGVTVDEWNRLRKASSAKNKPSSTPPKRRKTSPS